MTFIARTQNQSFHYELSLGSPDYNTILLAESDALSALTRFAISRCPSLRFVEPAVVDWLDQRLGDSSLATKRAAIAAMALKLDEVWRYANAPIREAAKCSQRRLGETLSFDDQLPNFARDAAIASGGALLFGAILVVIPEPARLQDLPGRARRAMMSFYRRFRKFGIWRASAWFLATKLAPWAELHLETRDLTEFSREGYLKSYRLIAHCLEHHKHLAGVCSASWLNDPKLAHISPHLEFVESTGIESGAVRLPLRTDADQYAFAAARSVRRRALIESGAYRPSCFGLYWTRHALLNWFGSTT